MAILRFKQDVSFKRQRAITQLLLDAGIVEDRVDAEGKEFSGGPPKTLAMMVEMALHGSATEDNVLDIITWSQRDLYDDYRPVARAILALPE